MPAAELEAAEGIYDVPTNRQFDCLFVFVGGVGVGEIAPAAEREAPEILKAYIILK